MRKKGFFVLAAAVFVLAICAPARAWHGAGHAAIALIAYRDLGPQKSKNVADILRQHPDYALWMSEKPAGMEEDAYLFMKASLWPDEIKAAAHPSHAQNHPTWHYIDRWFLDPKDTKSPTDEQGEFIIFAENKVEDEAKSTSDQAVRARDLCWMFHLIGDIHQPLHSTARVSAQFPNGDKGGNDEWVSGTEGAMNLHTYWDGLWNREALKDSSASKSWSSLRAEDMDISKIAPIADRVMAAHKRKSFRQLKKSAMDDMVAESYRHARLMVYLKGDLKAGSSRAEAVAFPDGYEVESKKFGEKQLALAGYRLADRLKSVLGL